MAGAEKKNQTIVIKKIKKGGHGHHGGAWKIAYADFVTAMMAFFLLMWLLGSTTKGDLQGIANYFNTPLKVAMSGGSGAGDSSSVLQGGGSDLTRTVGNVKRGDIEAKQRSYNLQALKADQRRAEQESLMELKGRIEAIINENPRLSEFSSQILLDITPEGLRIQIVDEQNRAMFDAGSAAVKEHMRELLRSIGQLVNEVPNRISLSGHTDSNAYGSGDKGYSNWELSTDRANASRRELVAGGLGEAKLLRVVGLAASLPFDISNPAHPMNRRISIIVMNQDAVSKVLNANQAIAKNLEDVKKEAENPTIKDTLELPEKPSIPLIKPGK
jgi:chemotaxis protein MotB